MANFTQAAIIIKNGKIVAEQYRGIGSSEVTQIGESRTNQLGRRYIKHDLRDKKSTALVTSWSIAKSITSILFGIALEQGYFSGSLETKASIYLTEWAGDSKKYHHNKKPLDMRSGLIPKCYSDLRWVVECDATGMRLGGGGFVSSNDQLTECINNRSMAATEALILGIISNT